MQRNAANHTALSAQGPAKADSRWSVSFSAGGAIPLGSFADIATMAGHTHTNSGLAAELAASYRICSSFDFVLAAGEQLNGGDGIAYNPYNIGAPVTSIYQDQTWKITRLTGGGTVNLPLQRNGRLNFFIRQLAGVQKTKAADFYRS